MTDQAHGDEYLNIGQFAHSNETTEFQIHYSKTLPSPARSGLSAWNPKFDLLCVVTANDNVLLYRMNGQRVWGIGQRKEKGETDRVVERLQWRPDGKSLALAYDDGILRTYDVHHGKVTGKIVSDNPDFKGISCIAWSGNGFTALDDPNLDQNGAGATPQSLFDLDVGQMLPKLSVLPSSSAPDSIFTSKVTLEAMINAVSKVGEGTNNLDVLFVCDSNGNLLLNLFETFAVGTISLNYLLPTLNQSCKIISHSAVGAHSTHSMLIQSGSSTVFATLDLLFINQFGQYLHQLASASTKLRNILRYIKETVQSLQSEWKTMNDLPSRYIRSISEEIREKGAADSKIELEFFELLMTGIPSEILKEWLVDVLGERNHKRWEKTSLTGYENLRRLVHENLLPACERLTVLLCRLRGLARWKERGSPLGLEPGDFTRCLDAVSGLVVLCHEFLTELNTELDLFGAFSAWLRHVLDDLSTVISINETKVDPQTDTLKVAQYLNSYLARPALAAFFADEPTTVDDEQQKVKELEEYTRGESIFNLYKEHNKATEAKVPGFRVLSGFLTGLCDAVFKKPALAMKRGLRMDRTLLICEGDVRPFDSRLVEDEEGIHAYMLMSVPSLGGLTAVITKCTLQIDGGLSTISKVGISRLSLGADTDFGRIVDLKFIDDDLIIAVAQFPEQHSSLVSFAYQDLEYSYAYPLRKDRGSAHSPSPDYGSVSVAKFAEQVEPRVPVLVKRRDFDREFVAREVQVNGKEGRRIGAVFSEDGGRYQVFDLDEAVEEEEAMDVEV